MTDRNYKEILFELEQGEEGCPADKWERLWACKVAPGQYSIDNIPVFVKGISTGDVVSVEQVGTELHFKKLIRRSDNSVFRLFVHDLSDIKATRETFRNMGCEWEQSRFPNLIAIEIPSSIPIDPVVALIQEGVSSGRWECEQGVLRHPVVA